MTQINPHNLKKAEMLELLTRRCKHRHLYIEHPNCWREERNHPPRVGYLDIEASNLKANFGIILSYAIKVRDEDKIYSRVITKDELNEGILDKDMVRNLIKDILKFDVVLGFYSTKFDIPYIRTRALYWKLDFPLFGYVQHKDVYYMARNKLCLHSNRLEVVSQHLGIKGKNHILGTHWIRALNGHAQSLEYILDHNIRDVVVLEKVHKKLEGFVRDTTKSI